MLVARALTLPSMEWECCLAQFTLKNLRSWILDRPSDQTKDFWESGFIAQGFNSFNCKVVCKSENWYAAEARWCQMDVKLSMKMRTP